MIIEHKINFHLEPGGAVLAGPEVGYRIAIRLASVGRPKVSVPILLACIFVGLGPLHGYVHTEC